MQQLRWWMRATGTLYLLQAVVAAILFMPIRVLAPPNALGAASAGDPTASLLVDTWVLFGLEVGTVGVILWMASRTPEQARPLVLAVLAIELVRGIGHDIYMLARGYEPTAFIVWIVVHVVVIGAGVLALRHSRSDAAPVALPLPTT
jgi:hypothetical protein